MPWKTISIVKDGSHDEKITDIEKTFERLLFSALSREGAEGAWLYCDSAPYPSPFRLYFSPRAVEIAESLIALYHGSVSEEPDWRSLVGLLGAGAVPA